MNIRIQGWWDNQDPQATGWYVQVVEIDAESGGTTIVDDSEKIWFPVDARSFGHGEACKLRTALEVEYPDAVSIKITP